MKSKALLVVAAVILQAVALAQPKGTLPRALEKYGAHASSNGASIGATRISDKQVQKTLSPDVEDCCVVVEVALYPAKDGKLEVALADFTLRTVGEENAINASRPAALASQLPYVVVLVSSGGGSGAAIGPPPRADSRTGGISRDPVTGMPRRDPEYAPRAVDMGVGVGSPDGNQPSDPQKREMEMKLAERGLPEGAVSSPMAGYLYFSLEKKKGAKYQLEYKLAGTKVVLSL